MKRLLLAVSTLALAAAVSPAVTSSAQAAPAKNPFCNMAKGQKNLVSWNAYYHCLGPSQAAWPRERYMRSRERYRVRRSAEYAPPSYAQYQPGQDNSQFCKLAKGEKNLVSWNAYYGCLHRR